jgi:hypothetical protein
MNATTLNAKLHISGRHVGNVSIRGWQGAWGIGNFSPTEHFAEFEPLFTRWSKLMHADDRRLSRENAKFLRDLEFQLYSLHVRLWIEEFRQWREVVILTIDGDMIEWKEPWLPGGAATPFRARKVAHESACVEHA